MSSFLKIVLVSTVLLAISSCSFKASTIPSTDFLKGPQELEDSNSRYPFNEVWISEKYKKERARFDGLYLKPVNLEFLLKTGDWKHISVYDEEEMQEKAKELGKYMQDAFQEAFSDEENERMKLVDEPRENALALEVAIVELIPTDVARNAAGNIIGFFVPGGGLVSAGAGGVVATEGKMTDSLTGELFAKFKDRESAKIRPIDLEGLSPFAFAREAMDDWAYQSMRLFNTPLDVEIPDTPAVSLSPW